MTKNLEIYLVEVGVISSNQNHNETVVVWLAVETTKRIR